jgi:hypothetical protein
LGLYQIIDEFEKYEIKYFFFVLGKRIKETTSCTSQSSGNEINICYIFYSAAHWDAWPLVSITAMGRVRIIRGRYNTLALQLLSTTVFIDFFKNAFH